MADSMASAGAASMYGTDVVITEHAATDAPPELLDRVARLATFTSLLHAAGDVGSTFDKKRRELGASDVTLLCSGLPDVPDVQHACLQPIEGTSVAVASARRPCKGAEQQQGRRALRHRRRRRISAAARHSSAAAGLSAIVEGGDHMHSMLHLRESHSKAAQSGDGEQEGVLSAGMPSTL